jgi:hypothetical protein
VQELNLHNSGFLTNAVMPVTTVNKDAANRPTAGAVCLQCLQKLPELHLNYGQVVAVVQDKPVATAVHLPSVAWVVAMPLEL